VAKQALEINFTGKIISISTFLIDGLKAYLQ
jgi:hypothetical protein